MYGTIKMFIFVFQNGKSTKKPVLNYFLNLLQILINKRDQLYIRNTFSKNIFFLGRSILKKNR